METIGILGSGIMARVLVEALEKCVPKSTRIVCGRTIRSARLCVRGTHTRATRNSKDLLSCDMVIVAVKPRDFATISLPVSKKTLIFSIMAGVGISTLRKQTGAAQIVRAMPNTAAKFGAGCTVWFATDTVSRKEKRFCNLLFDTMGTSLETDSEKDINKATAVSGSGPAYLIAMLLHFMHAAKKLGFSEKNSRDLVLQTFYGTHALIIHEPNIAKLIQQIASKGGTTEAALKVFKRAHLRAVWDAALKSAFRMAEELSKQ